MPIASTSFKGGLQTDLVFGADVSTAKELTNFHINSDGSVAKRPGLANSSPFYDDFLIITTADPVNPPNPLIKRSCHIAYWETELGKAMVEYGMATDSVNTLLTYVYATVYNLDTNGDPSTVRGTYTYARGGSTDAPKWLDYTSNASAFYIGYATSSFGSIEFLKLSIRPGVSQPLASRSMQVRDYWMTEFGSKERKNSININEAYCLYNQGWTVAQISEFQTDFPGIVPSIYDIPYYGKNVKALSRTDGASGGGFFDTALNSIGGAQANIPDSLAAVIYDYKKNMEEELPAIHTFDVAAPVGKSLISPYYRYRWSIGFSDWISDLNAAIGTTLVAIEVAEDESYHSGNNAIEVHGGRLFTYASTEGGKFFNNGESPNIDDFIFYSQPLTAQFSDIANHSTQSPTNEDFTPTASDGGFFTIRTQGKSVGLYSAGNILYIATTHDIKAIVSQTQFFDPTNFATVDILDVGIHNPRAIVEIPGGIVVYTTGERVYVVQGTQVQDITENRIRDKLVNHSIETKENIVVSYDSELNAIKLHVSEDDVRMNGLDFRNYRTEYVFYTKLAAWASNVISPAATGDTALVSVAPTTASTLPYEEDRENTSTKIQEYDRYSIGTQYLNVAESIAVGTVGSFANMRSKSFTDIKANPAQPYVAVLETNELVQQPQGKRNNTTYLTTYFLRTEDVDDFQVPIHQSACTVYGIYNYDYDPASNGQAAYYYDNIPSINIPLIQNVVHSKLKLPGNADNIRIRYESGEGKECVLLGYNLELNVNSRT